MVGVAARRLSGLGLVARFILIGASVGLLVATSLAWYVEARLTELLLAQVATRAIDQVKLGVIHDLPAADFAPPHTSAKLDDLDERLRSLLARVRDEGSGVIRLHVFAPDGTVLFSDLASKRGQVVSPATIPLLSAALAGSVGTGLSSLSSPENADLKARYQGALEVYVPFVLDGQIVGAYEIYQDLDPIRPVRPLVWSAVAAGFVVLFLSLLTVVRGAAARLQRQQAERERLLQQAAEAEKLRDMDRWKSELLSTVSHELRTPLSLVQGYTELLTDRSRLLNAEQLQQMVGEIQHGARTMARMVEDLLDFGRVEQGRLRLRLAETDLAEVVRQAVVSFITSQSGGERLRLELPSTPLWARVDSDRVSQIVVNLVSNALRYAPEGPILVRLQPASPGQAVLEVQDHGPGMTPEVLARVWEMFYRAPEATSSPIRGAGIGLALVKNLTEAHQGHVDALSAPGHGTTFRIHLPLEDTGGRAAPPREDLSAEPALVNAL